MNNHWKFDYFLARDWPEEENKGRCFVLATLGPMDEGLLRKALSSWIDILKVEPILGREPLFWTRLVTLGDICSDTMEAGLRAAGFPVRYAASMSHPSLTIGSPWSDRRVPACSPAGWKTRAGTPTQGMATPGLWFLREEKGGIGAERSICATGAGTRLAVIDDDALGAELLDLDAEILVGLERPPRSQSHGALMVGWAVGCPRLGGGIPGVAPDASPRLYCIPKPGCDMLSLPLAIVRAVDDGADVVLCATYVDGLTSPMLDDALEFAVRFGRAGRGTAVVLPTSREASSPKGRVHPSWTLGFGHPASDPRVYCIAPGSRGGSWFLWRDRRGLLRPFANRGPAVRWMAPGDDMASPLAASERLCHAESSGASAIAAGVLLLVLARNPQLTLPELDLMVTMSLLPAEGGPGADAEWADRADLLPLGSDLDGHNAKHGYGRMSAWRACLCAADPVCQTLLSMGEEGAAKNWWNMRAELPIDQVASADFLQRVSRELMRNQSLSHGLRVILRHLRLVQADNDSWSPHGEGALLRHLILFTRALVLNLPEAKVVHEIVVGLSARPGVGKVEEKLCKLAAKMFFLPSKGAEDSRSPRWEAMQG